MTTRTTVRQAAVVGAGSWGTALANLLAGTGVGVRLWAHEAEVVEGIGRLRENALFLPGVALHPSLAACAALPEALAGADLVLFVTPSHVAREVLGRSLPHLPPGAPVVVASKGIETESLETMAGVFGAVLDGREHPLAFLSGPSFAREVAAGLPTAVTLASHDPATAHLAQRTFSTPSFRVYTTDDVVGVEIGGAFKNVIAIAAGISDGLGLGSNARSALITRGLAEMSRLGVALGARAATFAGLAGLGDLVLTCTGDLSRNRSLGLALAAGRSLREVQAGTRTVAEGVRTTAAAVSLAKRAGVELPIAMEVSRVLFDGVSPRAALQELMNRSLRDETD